MTACAQESKSINPDAVNWIPYLTKNNNYIYVDKNLKQQLNTPFEHAEKFTKTGYAIVKDKDRKAAVIDSYGHIIIDYTKESIELEAVENLTLMKKSIEYDKKMPFWKWEWNILGGGVTKTQPYRKTEIRILESNQLIASEDIPYLQGSANIWYYSLDENHILMNGKLYKIKNKKLKKLKSNIEFALDKGRYIPSSSNKYNIYDIKKNKPILANMVGTDRLEITLNKQPFVLDSINQNYNYDPDIPKLLQNSNTNDIYTYPLYDKPFPKQIVNATEDQITFLKNVSLVYSVNDSPYFRKIQLR